MSLPHALLTALSEQPCSGSELSVRFDRSIGYFWQATHQQIYRELARLESSGFIESLPEESSRGRKRAYRILPAGRKELKQWTTQEVDPPALRDELMVRLWAEAAVGPAGLDRELRRRLGLHEAKLALYQKLVERDYADGASDRSEALHLVVLHSGIRYERMWIEVLTEALEALAEFPEPQRPARMPRAIEHATR